MISFVAASSGQTAATKTDTSVTCTPPSTIPGDVILAWVDAVNSADPTINGPAGWTLVGAINDPGSPTPFTSLWYRVVQAGDTTTPAWSSGTATTFNAVVLMSAYHGVDTTAPILTSAFAVEAATGTLKTTGSITTGASTWIVSGFADKTAGVNYSAFSHTERTQLRQTTTGIPSAALQDSNGYIAAGAGITQSVTGPSSSVGTSFIVALKAATRATIMPTGLVETFTGTNGVSVAGTNFSVTKSDNGGTATIQSNACRIRTGATAGNRTSIRLNGATRADAEIDFVWTVPASGTSQYPTAWMRTGSLVDTQNGYYFTLEPNDMVFGKSNASYVRTDLVTYTHGFTAGQVVHSRIAVFGNTQRARTWLESTAEPTSVWQITAADTAQPSAGYIGISNVSGTSGAKDLIVDTFYGTDTITPSQAFLLAGGSIAATGSLNKSLLRVFTGSITAAGSLTQLKVVTRLFSGSITAAGTLRKAFPRIFTGSVTAAGTMRKVAAKRLAGTVTPAATIRRSALKRLAGSITAAGTGVPLFVGRIFGRPGLVVVRLVQRAEVRIRHRKD